MARRTFFSFHYQRDVWRASIVRNSWLTQKDREEAGFFDASLWESAKTTGDAAIRRLINGALAGTSATAVLIGTDTWSRPWVTYEIIESWNRGNRLVGIYVHRVKDRDGRACYAGSSPFAGLRLEDGRALDGLIPKYDWVLNDGYSNLGGWLENAPSIQSV